MDRAEALTNKWVSGAKIEKIEERRDKQVALEPLRKRRCLQLQEFMARLASINETELDTNLILKIGNEGTRTVRRTGRPRCPHAIFCSTGNYGEGRSILPIGAGWIVTKVLLARPIGRIRSRPKAMQVSATGQHLPMRQASTHNRCTFVSSHSNNVLPPYTEPTETVCPLAGRTANPSQE